MMVKLKMGFKDLQLLGPFVHHSKRSFWSECLLCCIMGHCKDQRRCKTLLASKYVLCIQEMFFRETKLLLANSYLCIHVTFRSVYVQIAPNFTLLFKYYMIKSCIWTIIYIVKISILAIIYLLVVILYSSRTLWQLFTT